MAELHECDVCDDWHESELDVLACSLRFMIEQNVSRVLDPAGVARWWSTPLQRLHGLTPADALVLDPMGLLALSRCYLRSSLS